MSVLEILVFLAGLAMLALTFVLGFGFTNKTLRLLGEWLGQHRGQQ